MSDERNIVEGMKNELPVMSFLPPSFCSLLHAWQFVMKAARPMWHICNQLIMDISPFATVRTATFFRASLWVPLMILCYGD